jgi:uncharacterized membrane protein YhfC
MKSVRYLVIASLIFAFLCVASYLAAAPYAIIPFLSPLLMMAIPLGLGVFLYRRLKADWRIFGFGMLTFIGSQVLHIPFNSWTLLPALESIGFGADSPPGSLQLAVFAVIVGLSSGVFEETARYIVYSRWLEKARTWKDGLMFGAGHGGVEALIVGVIVLLTFLQALTIRNGDMSQLPPEQIEAAIAFSDAYWNIPWYVYLLPLLERISAIIFHLSAALLVLHAFTRRNILWYLAAILLHTVFNALAVFGLVTWGPYVAEGLILFTALFSLWIVFALRTKDDTTPQENAPDVIPDKLKKIQTTPATPTTEKLEDSRYD